MNKKDEREVQEQLFNIYSGLLFASAKFTDGPKEHTVYEFTCPEFKELKVKYPIEEKAGKGTDFQKAIKLIKWLAPELKHDGNYCKDIPMDAASLLDYSYGKPENGINCVCKAKILQECCLALNIFARRVWMFPASCYDEDNHVVNEIYDRKMKKWIMIDLSTGGYFVDERKNPLSLLELRECFANGQKAIFVLARQSLNSVAALYEKNFAQNVYFAKNLYYFCLEEVSTYGTRGGVRYVVPCGLDVSGVQTKNISWKLKLTEVEHWDDGLTKSLLAQKGEAEKGEQRVVHIRTMQEEPDWKQLLNYNLADLLKK
ncbi:MAG: hypothetical protein LUI60_05930 [Clostridia bacterium]|nr:hypothetical protein [Clostridia bacterium]